MKTEDLYVSFVFDNLTDMLEIFEVFIDSYFVGKTGNRQAEAALKHWENHAGQDPYQIDLKDVDRFVYKKLNAPKDEDKLKPATLSLYLLYIAKFYEWLGGLEKPDSAYYATLAKYMREKSAKLAAQIHEPSGIDLQDAVEMLTEITDLQGELLVRLLVFTEIPVGCLNDLRVRDIHNDGTYGMNCGKKIIDGLFYSDTPQTIHKYIVEKKLQSDDKLIDMSQRQIEYLIPRFARKAGISKRVTPKDLKEFGKDRRLRKWLIREYEKRARGETT